MMILLIKKEKESKFLALNAPKLLLGWQSCYLELESCTINAAIQATTAMVQALLILHSYSLGCATQKVWTEDLARCISSSVFKMNN